MKDKNEIKILRELVRLFSVSEKDLPKTIQRFKDEIEEMEKELRELKQG